MQARRRAQPSSTNHPNPFRAAMPLNIESRWPPQRETDREATAEARRRERKGKPRAPRRRCLRQGRCRSRTGPERHTLANNQSSGPFLHPTRAGETAEPDSETERQPAERGAAGMEPGTRRTRTERETKVATARGLHLFPFRTEKLNPATPMVLRKWESR